MRHYFGWRLVVVAILISFLLSAVSAFAQYRAGLQGAVTDTTGAVVPDATVTLTSKETNISRTARTSGSGVYSIPSLAPGRYSLTVEKEGFAKKTIDDVLINAEQTQAMNVELAVGQAAQSVTVSAETLPTLETQTAIVGGTITNRDVQSLPSYGRDPFQLLRLAPGAFGQDSLGGNLPGNAGPGGTNATQSIFQTENQPQISANGQRISSNDYQVDGMSVNSIAWNGAAVITPNTESVKEVQVIANDYSAEHGRNNGAQVLVVSQNGTNSFHGSGLLKVHRPGLNAFQKWNGPGSVGPGTPEDRGLQRDNDRFNQWAASVGGPIWKDKLFFFFSYETLRLRTVSTGTGWYETPEFLSSAPAAGIAERILGFPGEGVSFNAVIPRTCSDAGLTSAAQCQAVSGGLDVGSPLSAPLGTRDSTFGQAGTPFGIGSGLDGVPDVFFVNTTNPTERTAEQWNGRLDFQATSKDMITFSTYWTPVTTNFFNGPVRPANAWTNDRLNWSAALVETHTFGPSLLNEARFNATRWSWDEIASNPQEPWGLPQSNITPVGGANVQFFGAPGPSVFAETTYNFRDTVSKVFNNHSLKFGADIYREQRLDTSPGSARPSYTFNNLWDFANDAPSSEVGNFDPITGQPSQARRHIRSGMYAGFVQDDWKVRPNLTLNLGLRWEYFGPVSDINDNISNVTLGSGANTLTGLRLKTGGTLYNASMNNWGPQIGFAWSPNRYDGRVVFRGGFGIGYNRQQEANILDVRNNPPGGIVNLTFVPGQILYAVPDDVNQFENWPTNPNAVQAFDPNTGLPLGAAAINLVGVQDDLPTPMTYRYSLDTQFDMGANWVATVGYQGSQTRHNMIKQNLNALFAALNPSVQRLEFYTNIANTSYNALLTELKHRFSQTFEVDVQYRWSHTIDQGSNDYYIPTYPWNTSLETGSADFDVRHNFKLFGSWSPRFFGGQKGWMEKVLGGWTISGILNWHSGFPWTPLIRIPGCSNSSGGLIYDTSRICSLRPAAFVGGVGGDQSNDAFMTGSNFPGDSLNFFTPASFTVGPAFPASGPIPQAPGVARNIFRGPKYLNLDMTLSKAFGLPRLPVVGENASFEVRASAYNILNKLNLTPFTPPNCCDVNTPADVLPTLVSVDGTTSNPSFGQAQTARPGRVVELQARFSF